MSEDDFIDYHTRIVHTGMDTDPHTGASSIPIYQASTFAQNDPVKLGRYVYARAHNPTRDALEHAIAALEHGSRGFAFSSGMAAISSAFLLFSAGDHVVVCEDVYGGTYRALTTHFNRWGLQVTFADATDPDRIKAALRDNTRAIFIETPSNPTLKITDMGAIASIARERGILSIIDNTFMTPYLQRPIEHGIDIVLHSATKFLGGHSDLIAGLAVTSDPGLGARMFDIQTAFGAILGPTDSWLLIRGMKTLGARMDAQGKTAAGLSDWLQHQRGIKRVYYPTLSDHPGREVHMRQSTGGGAVVSFELDDTEVALKFMRAIRIPIVAVSLGGVESILSYPATMSHSSMSPDERAARGIGDNLVRLSVGLEGIEDLKADIAQALSQAIK